MRKMKKSLVVLLALFSLHLPLVAQSRGLEVIDSVGRQITSFSGSYALIIGESNYNNGWAKLDGVRLQKN